MNTLENGALRRKRPICPRSGGTGQIVLEVIIHAQLNSITSVTDFWLTGKLFFGAENKKIIHLVALHKIVLRPQNITRFRSLLDYNVATYAMVFSITVAINNSNLRSRPKRGPQISQQRNGLINFVVSLQQQDSVNPVRRQLRVIVFAENCFHIAQAFFLHSLVDITRGLRIDVDGIDHAGVGHTTRRSYCKPARPGADIGYGLAGRDREDVHHAADLKPLISSRRIKDRKIPGVRRAGFSRFSLDRGRSRALSLNKNGTQQEKNQHCRQNPMLEHEMFLSRIDSEKLHLVSTAKMAKPAFALSAQINICYSAITS